MAQCCRAIVVDHDQVGERPCALVARSSRRDSSRRSPTLKPVGQARVVFDVTRTVVLIGLYLAAGIAFLVAVNADQANGDIPFYVLTAAAILLGWATGNVGRRGLPLWILLPWILVPLGLPFGDENAYSGGDDLWPVAAVAIFPAFTSMVLMLLAAGARSLYERRHHTAPPTAA